MTLPNIRLLLITIVVSFAANWQFGYQITYINPAYNVFRKFAEDISVSPNDISKSVPFDDADFSFWWGIIVSSFYPGTVIGFVIVPYMINRFGTRASFAYSCIPVVQHLYLISDKEIFPILLIVGRTLIGIQSGCSLSLLPLFIIEISEESENSFLCTFQQISQSTSMSFYKSVKSSAKTKNKSFTKRNVWKGLVIGCIAAISYAFTADDMIDSYSSNMIRSAFPHLADLWIDLTAVFFGSILLVCSVFGSFLIEKYGAKKSLVYGLIGTAIANAVASIGDYTGYFYITALAFSWFLTSELVPVHSQNIAQSMSTGCLLMATGVVTYLYPTINKSLGSFTLLYMASIPALILATILVLFLPEVHKKNYSQINYKLRAFFFSGLNHKESSNDEERNINMYIVQPEIATEYPVNILKIQNYGTCASDINKHTQSLGLF
uniref:MFS domain-containing protein n=1 Tax=Rhabditophanes sp. KR3021 TaxID=114890 RepID=A0AC35TSL9_9BILA